MVSEVLYCIEHTFDYGVGRFLNLGDRPILKGTLAITFVDERFHDGGVFRISLLPRLFGSDLLLCSCVLRSGLSASKLYHVSTEGLQQTSRIR